MEVAATEAREPEAVLAQANTHLRDTLAKGTFVTMAYAILDPESSVVTFARAGHNPPVWGRAGGAAELVAPPGTALGAAPPRTFERLLAPHRVELRRGDVLVFYTDGVTEAMNTAHQEFGEERLLAAVARHRDGLSARALVGKVLEEVTDFSRGASQHDDITLVVIKAS
jgi:sigma-B regulation protein RsbU (phosphoserine phosphatase)